MIVFQTSTNQKIDFSQFGVSITEESSLFSNNLFKSYSIPFLLPFDHDLLIKLGLPHLDNISGVETMVKGKLLLPYQHFEAILFLGEIRGSEIECNLSFGDHELPVYKMKLADLPWPVQLASNYASLVNTKLVSTWPDAAYNFPRIYSPDIREKSGYESFLGFINNHSGLSPVFNNIDSSGEEPVYHNYNVLAPCPYLLEIIRFIYLQEGKKVTGEIFEDEILKRALYIPKNYLEKFRGADFTAFSLSTPTVVENEFGIYRKEFIPERIGTYEIDYKLNLDPVIASYFEFKIYMQDPVDVYDVTMLKESRSENNRVRISDKLKVNITAENQFSPIIIELKLNYRAETIATLNQFEYTYGGGKLNDFPSSFSLSDFVPDMTAWEFINLMKNWLNLDIVPMEDKVEINFTQNSILKKHREKHEHLKVPQPYKKHNSNRFYKLFYANGESVFYNRNGQVFSDIDETGAEVIEMKMDVQPAVVEQNEDIMTAVKPTERSKLDFCLFQNPGFLQPDCAPEFAADLNLQNVFNTKWIKWLEYRVNSKTFKESFECSVHERLHINELSFKYNELHVIRKLKKKFLSENVMKVDVESETF